MALDLKKSFGTKIGPLPAVAWIGGAAVVYVLYRYMQARKATAAATTTDPTAVDTSGTGTLGDTLNNPGFTDATGLSTGGSSVVGVGTSTEPTNNMDWGKLAANYLIGNGANPADAEAAISTYLFGTGNPLNATQSALLSQALRFLGTPPEGVIIPPPTTDIPAPSPNQPAPATPAPVVASAEDPFMGGFTPQPAAGPPPAPPAPPPPAPAPIVMDQGMYQGALGDYGTFSQAGGYLDQFFTNPQQVQILGPNGQPATTTQVLADLRARGLQVKPTWQAIN